MHALCWAAEAEAGDKASFVSGLGQEGVELQRRVPELGFRVQFMRFCGEPGSLLPPFVYGFKVEFSKNVIPRQVNCTQHVERSN